MSVMNPIDLNHYCIYIALWFFVISIRFLYQKALKISGNDDDKLGFSWEPAYEIY